MSDTDKLKEVAGKLTRILVALPEFNVFREPLADVRDDINRYLKSQVQNQSLAQEFSDPGTLKRFLLTRGFMPHDEKDAEAIMDGIIRENER